MCECIFPQGLSGIAVKQQEEAIQLKTDAFMLLDKNEDQSLVFTPVECNQADTPSPPFSITLNELVVHEAFDADADGVVTTEELKALLDADSDGSIAGDEAVVDLTEFVASIYDKLPEPLRNPNNREKAVKPAYDEATQALIDAAIAARHSAAEATRIESSTNTDLRFD